MKKILNGLVFALCLMAGSAFGATEGRPVFQGWAQDPVAFKATLVELGALKDGFVHVDEIDKGKGNGVAPSLLSWMIQEKLVNEAGKNIQFFTDELVKVNGNRIPEDQFMSMAFAGKFIVPPSVLANTEVASVAPAVQASSATAVAPVVQFAPSLPPAEREKFAEQLAGLKNQVEAQAKTIEANATTMSDLQGQLQKALVDPKSTEAQKKKLADLQGKVTDILQAINKEAERVSKGLANASLASGENLSQATNKLQKQIEDIVADASAVLGRVSATEKGVTQNTDSINNLWSTMALVAVTILLLILGVSRGAKKNTSDAIKAVNAKIAEVEEEVGAVKTEVEIIGTMVGKREVVFPDMFSTKVESVAESTTEPSYVAKLEVQGAGAVMVTVTHAKPGYVHVSGVPGHDATLPVRLYKPKASKKFNGVQLLVFAVANRGGFDHLNNQLKAA